MRRYRRLSCTKPRPHVAPGKQDIPPETKKQRPRSDSPVLEIISEEIAQAFLLCFVLFLVATFSMTGNIVLVSVVLANVLPKVIRYYFPKRKK